MSNFINYSLFTSILLLITGIYLFIFNPTFLYFIIIVLGISSISNHINNSENSTYNITCWPLSRIIDWTIVIIFFITLFINYYSNIYLYVLFFFNLVIYLFIIWINIFKLNNNKLILIHSFKHILLIIFLLIFKMNK